MKNTTRDVGGLPALPQLPGELFDALRFHVDGSDRPRVVGLIDAYARAYGEQCRAASEPVEYSEKFRHAGDWSRYPMGTRAHAIQGGYWVRGPRGWTWQGGNTFPTPGADAIEVSVPIRALSRGVPEGMVLVDPSIIPNYAHEKGVRALALAKQMGLHDSTTVSLVYFEILAAMAAQRKEGAPHG